MHWPRTAQSGAICRYVVLRTSRLPVMTGQVERSPAYIDHLEQVDGPEAGRVDSRVETSMLRIS
jgi:hypothetical protein